MRIAAIAVTTVSAHFWGASIASVYIWVLPLRVTLALLAAAAMTGVIATQLWLVRGLRCQHRDALGVLARTLAHVTRPPGEGRAHLRREK